MEVPNVFLHLKIFPESTDCNSSDQKETHRVHWRLSASYERKWLTLLKNVITSLLRLDPSSVIGWMLKLISTKSCQKWNGYKSCTLIKKTHNLGVLVVPHKNSTRHAFLLKYMGFKCFTWAKPLWALKSFSITLWWGVHVFAGTFHHLTFFQLDVEPPPNLFGKSSCWGGVEPSLRRVGVTCWRLGRRDHWVSQRRVTFSLVWVSMGMRVRMSVWVCLWTVSGHPLWGVIHPRDGATRQGIGAETAWGICRVPLGVGHLLVVGLHGWRHHMEHDDWRAHGLTEHVLGSETGVTGGGLRERFGKWMERERVEYLIHCFSFKYLNHC